MNILKKLILCVNGVYRKKPDSVTIGVTSACNGKCLFCAYHGEDAENNSKVYNLPFSLSFQDFKRIVDMAYEGGVPHVHIRANHSAILKF